MGLFDKFKKKQETESIAPVTPPKPFVRTRYVYMKDGSVKEFPFQSVIDNEKCVICMGKYYHTNLFCTYLDWETRNCDNDIREYTVAEAKENNLDLCIECFDADTFGIPKIELE